MIEVLSIFVFACFLPILIKMQFRLPSDSNAINVTQKLCLH